MSIDQFKPKMREVRLDTEVFEERFTEYDISEFTGIILTLVAIEAMYATQTLSQNHMLMSYKNKRRQ
ncbi:hypothetical protein [Lysinibacillus fusiformis]|uniref:hypothetical protein n=1 Tax=Lysinibacillus fusiformis TaxID=28031 RepID=UPI002E1E9A78|nr:hypothetical protein [Lysinibacillus fusiformis]